MKTRTFNSKNKLVSNNGIIYKFTDQFSISSTCKDNMLSVSCNKMGLREEGLLCVVFSSDIFLFCSIQHLSAIFWQPYFSPSLSSFPFLAPLIIRSVLFLISCISSSTPASSSSPASVFSSPPASLTPRLLAGAGEGYVIRWWLGWTSASSPATTSAAAPAAASGATTELKTLDYG